MTDFSFPERHTKQDRDSHAKDGGHCPSQPEAPGARHTRIREGVSSKRFESKRYQSSLSCVLFFVLFFWTWLDARKKGFRLEVYPTRSLTLPV